MKIYLLTTNSERGHHYYEFCVVCAENENDAKTISPEDLDEVFKENDDLFTCWARKVEEINCLELGTANENQKRGVIISSYVGD